MRIRVLGIVLAGGKGTRLYPLTRERAKPAVPFGGKYRIIDFVLSNFINSGIYSIYVLTQFRSQSLLQHLSEGWQFGSLLKSQFIIPVPAQMRSAGETWYQGTADAIYQNINLVEQSDPHVVAIFGGDHIYRMNVMSMIEYHVQKSAEVTVAAIPVDRRHASEFGVIETSEDGHILGFHEKNPDAPTMPGDENRVYASMGNYVFSTRTLLRMLHDDAAEEASNHDFGRDILPKLAGKSEIYAYDFQTNRILGEPAEGEPYWRDVGTIDAYYEANMDLRSVKPALNLYNREWPLRSTSYPDPPAKFTFDDENRRGQAIDTIVSGGCILSGGTVHNSVLGRGVRVHARALVDDCVILDNCDIGRRAKVKRAILDKNVRIPEDAVIGYDLERDRLHHHVTESGIVVIGGARTPVDITGMVVGRVRAFHLMEQQVLGWIAQYGYAAIFALLMFGIVGLPIPDETLLTFCGFLVFQGRLSLPLAFGAAFAGSACGITLSYVLGRTFGLALIHRYGRYLRITEDHIHKAHAWFARAGHWALTFGYFVPGVRHLTAYAAGISEVEPHQFALFAYSGGILWVSVFLSLGYFLGERWEAVERNIHHYLVWITVAGAIALLGYLVWRKLREKRR